MSRPKIHKTQKRITITLSDEAWEVVKVMKPGKRSELFSILAATYAPQFPLYFAKKKRH